MKQLEILLTSATDTLQYQHDAHKLIALINYKYEHFVNVSPVEYVGNSMRFTLTIPGVQYKVIIDIFNLFTRMLEMAREAWYEISRDSGGLSDLTHQRILSLKDSTDKLMQLDTSVYWCEWTSELSLATIDSIAQRKGIKLGSSDVHSLTVILQTYLDMRRLEDYYPEDGTPMPASLRHHLIQSELCEKVYEEVGWRYLRKTRTSSLVHALTDAVLYAAAEFKSLMALFDPETDYLSLVRSGWYYSACYIQLLREFITLLWSMPLTMDNELATVGGIFYARD
jgi:hypothetical protein